MVKQNFYSQNRDNLRYIHKTHVCYNKFATHPAKMFPHNMLVYDKQLVRSRQIYFLLGAERTGFPTYF